MSVRFQKKSLIWIGGIVLLILVLTIILPLLFRVHSPEKEQYKAEKKRLSEIFMVLDTSYWRNQDTSLSLCSQAVNISVKIGDSNAYAEALFNKARIVGKFEINDSSFLINNQALAISEKVHNDTLIAKVKIGIGDYYYYKDNYYLAILYYTEAENIAIKIHNDYLLAKAANGLGLVYIELNDLKKAIEYYEKAIHKLEKLADIQKGYIYDYCGALRGIGVCYMYNDDFFKATLYQKKALEKANQLNDLETLCKIYGNLGAIEQYLGKNASALNYFTKVLEYSSQGNKHSKRHVTILHNLGAHYLFNKQYNKAEKLLNQSLSISSEMGFKSMEGGNDYALSELKKKQGQWQKAYEYYTRWQGINDSLLSLDTKKKISDYQWEMKSQKKRYEEELILKRYEIQKKRNLILIIAIISVVILALMVGRNMKKSVNFQKLQNTYLHEKIEADEKIGILEKLRYQSEIEGKNKELASSSIQIITKNDILSDIEDLANRSFKNKQMDNSTYNNLKKILNENLNMDKDWDQFKKMFEEVHKDFFIKLKQICPELTENEMRLCAYLKINLQNKEIAKILNINPATVATNRYHVRKKLNLDKLTSLESYIREI